MRIRKQQRAQRPKTTPRHADDATVIFPAEGKVGKNKALIMLTVTSNEPTKGGNAAAPVHAGETANNDRSKLHAFREKTRQKLKWAKRLNCIQLGLAALAIVLACYVSSAWLFVAWAGTELGLVLHVGVACLSLKRLLYLLQFDLARGVVHESIGRVKSFRVFWRVIEDNNSAEIYLIVGPLRNSATATLGSTLRYRAAPLSQVVLWFESEVPAEAIKTDKQIAHQPPATSCRLLDS